MKKYLFFFPLLFYYCIANSQNETFYLNTSFDNTLEKKLYCTDSIFHTSVKPYLLSDINKITDYKKERKYDSLKSPYKNKIFSWVWDAILNRHFVEIQKDEYSFYIDPLMNFQFGYDFSDKKDIYVNMRGFQAGGSIGKSFSFYTMFQESQAVFPKYVDDFVKTMGVIPGVGIPKVNENGKGYDYSYAEGYISYTPSKYFNFRFGQFKNFWGDGYRSLFLSDNSAPYPQLLITTDFWRIKYVNLYAQMGDIWGESYNDAYRGVGFKKKMVSAQYLSWAVTDRWNLGFFEAVIYQTYDTNGNYTGINWSYLNPVIFLRPAEFQQGSPDNMMIGLGTSVRVGKRNILYSQFILGEFKFSEIKNWGNGWWGNKNGFQAGIKLFDLFSLENLYFQAEYNTARPYMYSDKQSSRCWGQYNLPMAHPTGANFQEALGIIKYNYKRFYFEYKFNYLLYGADTNGSDWGKNIFLPYDERESDYGNFTGQGLRTTVIYNDFKTSWLVNPVYNLNVFAGVQFRNLKNDLKTENSQFIYFGIATSIGNYYYDF